jgi:tRNA nucleotidyltransferase (CCA-adding enzyme)
VVPTGIQHGTVTVLLDGTGYEVTTLRGEGAYTDGRRPDSVTFVRSVHDDLARRDFTVNAIAYDPLQDELVDAFDGLGDLARGVIRAVGDATARFGEDGLRVLRAARFVATLEFALEPSTEAAIGANLETFRRVSAERVRDEWLKTMKARSPSRAFEVMRRTGILGVVCPELLETVGFALEPDREGDVWSHTMRALDATPTGDPVLRIAALLHDIAKPRTREMGERGAAHPLHGALGAVAARARDGGDERVQLAELRARARRVLDAREPLTTRDLAVDGRDLMKELGIPPSRRLGEVLEALLDRVIDDPALNQRDVLLDVARGL